MSIAAGGHTVSSLEHGGGGGGESKIKGFSLFGNKIHHSEIRILFPNNYEKFGKVGSYANASETALITAQRLACWINEHTDPNQKDSSFLFQFLTLAIYNITYYYILYVTWFQHYLLLSIVCHLISADWFWLLADKMAIHSSVHNKNPCSTSFGYILSSILNT